MSILDLFAKSPFKPMREHMRVVSRAAEGLVPLFEALVQGDREALRRAEAEIDRLEGEADKLKNDLRAHLPNRLLLPVDRRDLLEILDLQDSIADLSQDIAHLLVQRDMPVPEPMRATLEKLVQGVELTCSQSHSVIECLDELVEIGFRGRGADRVSHMIDELGRLEAQTDERESELIGKIFMLEDELGPVSVMLWYQLTGWIGRVADCAEKVGNRVRLLIAS